MLVTRIALALCSGLVLSTVAMPALAGSESAPSNHGHSHTPGPSVAIGTVAVNGAVSAVMGLDGFAGGNVGVSSGPDGLLVIDDMLPGFQSKLEGVLGQLKTCMDCGDLKYLINTHWHFDHAGNNDYFGGAPVLIAHESVRPLLASPQDMKAFNMVVPAKTRAGLPDMTFAKRASVYFNGEEVTLTHFPKSHTSGDIIVHFTKSNVVHMGDLYFNGMFPFVDLDHGGSVQGLIKSIEAAVKRYPADAHVIPGHGPLSGMEGVKAFLEMLKSTTRTVEKAKAAGMSLEQVQKQGLDERWTSWAWEFISTDTWIALIYKSA